MTINAVQGAAGHCVTADHPLHPFLLLIVGQCQKSQSQLGCGKNLHYWTTRTSELVRAGITGLFGPSRECRGSGESLNKGPWLASAFRRRWRRKRWAPWASIFSREHAPHSSGVSMPASRMGKRSPKMAGKPGMEIVQVSASWQPCMIAGPMGVEASGYVAKVTDGAQRRMVKPKTQVTLDADAITSSAQEPTLSRHFQLGASDSLYQ